MDYTTICLYIKKLYIDFDANFGPELWASESEKITRKNNRVEIFHMHLNSQCILPFLTFT